MKLPFCLVPFFSLHSPSKMRQRQQQLFPIYLLNPETTLPPCAVSTSISNSISTSMPTSIKGFLMKLCRERLGPSFLCQMRSQWCSPVKVRDALQKTLVFSCQINQENHKTLCKGKEKKATPTLCRKQTNKKKGRGVGTIEKKKITERKVNLFPGPKTIPYNVLLIYF